MFRRILILLIAACSSAAFAGPGHDHGPEAVALPGATSPRFSAVSEAFELVGVLEGRTLLVYLDRFADNRPVPGATVEIDLGGAKVALEPAGDGIYRGTLPAGLPSGVIAVSATVRIGGEADLLAGELDLHEDPRLSHGGLHWHDLLPWVMGAFALLGIAGGAWRRRRSSAVAAGILVLLASPPLPTSAGEGHDHSAPTAGAPPDAPKRLPDGSVFLPKPAQRQLAVRTQVAKREPLARAVELAGRVVMDPNAGGKVQPMNAGRIEPGAKGLPAAGQRVAKGEVLAYILPAIGPAERGSQAAMLAELRAQQGIAEKRLARLRDLADTVPRKEIEAAEGELIGLSGRIAALNAGLSGREALLAPVGGVIASGNVVAGQVVDAREVVFEIVDPRRLRIEALAYEPALAQEVAGGALLAGGEPVRLQFAGAAQALRENALPLYFRGEGEALAKLALGQAVRVVVRLRAATEAIALPSEALARDASNRAIVWVKVAPERFVPRPVAAAPLDASRIAITAGIEPGERVVTGAAGLVNQIR